MLLKGTITALITPFQGKQIDEEGFIENIHFQLQAGVDGLLVLGSTGEASTLSEKEKKKIITLAVQEVRGKVPVIVGTGSNCTRTALSYTEQAKELGADGALVVIPYYNKPTQEGIFAHFDMIAQKVALPLVIYNNPGRCAAGIEPETLLQLTALSNIIGIKEGSGNLSLTGDMMKAVKKLRPDFLFFSSDDILTLPMMALGAVGVISVASNLVPQEIRELTLAASQGRFDLAQKKHFKLLPLFKALFLESNPIPIKAAMQLCKKAAGKCRLPLTEIAHENKLFLKTVLGELEIS